MSDDSDDIEELDLTAEGQKYHDGPDFQQRQTIMRQLLNELLITNEWMEKERNHPFSSLEVILEEITPCSSAQQLEMNFSAIGHRGKCNNEESATDSDEEDTRQTFFHNENSLERDPNMYTFKRYNKNDFCNSEESSTSGKTGHTFNDSNTSNIDTDVKESCNKTKQESPRKNKKAHHKSNFENTEKLYCSKFEKFINDDERYVKNDKPKPQKRRNKFLTLNHNYDRDRNVKMKRKVCSTSNLSRSDEVSSFRGKKSERTKSVSVAEGYQRKCCSTSNLTESNEPVKVWKKKPQKALKRSDSFKCFNTYCIPKKPEIIKHKEYCEEDVPCPDKYSIKNPPDDNISVEELEDRLQYFESQYLNLQDELNKAKEVQLKLMQGNEVNSSDDEVRWCTASNKTFNLDRGDTKSMEAINKTIDKPDKTGHSDSSPNDSLNSFNDNKSQEIYSDVDPTEYKDIEKDNEPSYSGNIFIAQKPSRDSGLQTYSADNSRENVDESPQDELFPKVMYATVNKSVSTQVTDDDWVRICTAKKEMATRGCLKLSLPNSSDDELLDEDETKPSERKVEFKPKTIIIHDYSDYSDISSNKKSTSIADTTRTDLLDKKCSCFPCNCFFRFKR